MDLRVMPMRAGKRKAVVIKAPASKSYTHRALFVAAMGGKRVVVENPSFCDDNIATLRFLADLGCRIVVEGPAAQMLVDMGAAKPLRGTSRMKAMKGTR